MNEDMERVAWDDHLNTFPHSQKTVPFFRVILTQESNYDFCESFLLSRHEAVWPVFMMKLGLDTNGCKLNSQGCHREGTLALMTQ